ncbi:geranylgeranylglyceryl phosphate synthase [Fulvitalea axinellae]|uniref:Geranylgeranylglyceryl phosphate synthase n=2 Tax=Fulvitalea axinellae TaxID=1182444 RepID=A0AAU9CQ52_9BACT|nr:geranylgeranylglyceryl phosphate synthase [Fulvitalea axinellae]
MNSKSKFEEWKARISEGKKSFAVLIDPDKIGNEQEAITIAKHCDANSVDWIFVGGSLLTRNNTKKVVESIKATTDIPVVLFPGDATQVCPSADILLFLSLVSGRNPEYLIGQHIKAAPIIKETELEVWPTAYILVESGKKTSVSYISNTEPIPSDKPEIASCTALASEMLGMKCVYLEAGSGAEHPVPEEMIRRVRKDMTLPLIVGGGIRSAEKAQQALIAGADMIVIGNAIEKNPGLMTEVSECILKMNRLDVHQ